MTSLQAYQNFLIKGNRIDSNSNINIPKGKFVIIFNEQAKKWLKQKLRFKLSSDESDELSSVLVPDYKLKFKQKLTNCYVFDKPKDFLRFETSYSIAKKGKCRSVISNWEFKGKDINIILGDSNNNPSFEYQETPLRIIGDTIKIYVDGFVIEEAFLDYYKYPKDIDIEGYIKEDGTSSTNIDPDLPDLAVNEITNRCALEVFGISENTQGFQISKDRILTEE